MKKVPHFTIVLFFLTCFTKLNAQFILAGQYGAKDYYHLQATDSIILGVFNGPPIIHQIDINGDGIDDFEFYVGCGKEVGVMGTQSGHCNINSKNNNEIAWAYTYDTCVAYQLIDSAKYAKRFVLNDSISANKKWVNWGTGLSSYEYNKDNPCGSEFNSFKTGGGYIGVRVFVAADTLYGWIRVNSVSKCSLVLEEYASHSSLTGINDSKNAVSIYIYPNPVRDRLTYRIACRK